MLAVPPPSVTDTIPPAFSSLQPGTVINLQHHARHVVGVVRFRGPTSTSTSVASGAEGAPADMLGVELAFPSGSCDGERGGTQYFHTNGTLTMAGTFLSERGASESRVRLIGALGDGGAGDAAWAGFPRAWNDRRRDEAATGAPPQFVCKILHSKFPLIEEVALSRDWCVVTGSSSGSSSSGSEEHGASAAAAPDSSGEWDLCWSDNFPKTCI
jgi:hypothetical protein